MEPGEAQGISERDQHRASLRSPRPEIERLAAEGFSLVTGVLEPTDCATLARQAASVSASSVGSRCLLPLPWCAALARRLREHPTLSPLWHGASVAVQCTYFEKSVGRNWLVPVHQDLSIPVAERTTHPDLRGWSEKEGALFVQGPPSVLERMIAVRLHLDPCMGEDGPLRVVPGSHSRGLIGPAEAARARTAEVTCLARQGDALVMRPLLLHASSRATGAGLRRVLHFLFGPPVLPYGLRWHHAV
jgi:hypothetical protein